MSTHHEGRKEKFGVKAVHALLIIGTTAPYNLAHFSLDTGSALVDGILEYEVVKRVEPTQDAGHSGLVLLVLVLGGVRLRGGGDPLAE